MLQLLCRNVKHFYLGDQAGARPAIIVSKAIFPNARAIYAQNRSTLLQWFAMCNRPDAECRTDPGGPCGGFFSLWQQSGKSRSYYQAEQLG
jgi:hypothetical protein